MVPRKKITVFEVLVYVAYTFFILLAGSWFVIGLLKGGHFNYLAFTITAIFCVQTYFQNRIWNLVIGILSLICSIWMLLTVISTFDLMAKNATFDGLTKSLMGIFCVGIIMSCIIIFSYTKLSFKDQQH